MYSASAASTTMRTMRMIARVESPLTSMPPSPFGGAKRFPRRRAVSMCRAAGTARASDHPQEGSPMFETEEGQPDSPDETSEPSPPEPVPDESPGETGGAEPTEG